MMNAIKRHWLFSVWLACCMLFAGGGGYGWHRLRREVRREMVDVTHKIQERGQLLQQLQQPIPEKVELSTIEPRAVVITAPAEEERPRKPLDAFIAIAGVKTELRRLATNLEVTLLSDEPFGFATYAHEGPPESQLSEVHEQLRLIRSVAEKLFAARPDKLFAIRREPTKAEKMAGPPAVATDWFSLDNRLDPRRAGLLEGRAIRVEFTGQTTVLRIWLNALAAAPEQLLVRSVEVEPLGEGTKALSHHSLFSVVVVQAKPTGTVAGMEIENRKETTLANWAAEPGAVGEYELFTPPMAQRRARPKATTAASSKQSEDRVDATAGWELLAVKRAPYRLQLVGYFGTPGNYTVNFVSGETPETLRGRVGHRFEALGLVLKDFAVKRIETNHEAGPPGFALTAVAELWDERQQEQVILHGHERRFTATPLAIVRLGPSRSRPREFRVGDTFHAGLTTHRIERIQFDPAEVVIVAEAASEAAPERITLTLKPKPGGQ